MSCAAALGVRHVSRLLFAFQGLLDLTAPGGQRVAVPFAGRLRVDHGLAAREALLAGRGIAPAHVWLVDNLLAAGTLETVLPGYEPSAVPLSMLLTPARASVARVRLMADFLAGAVAGIPGLRPAAAIRTFAADGGSGIVGP